MLGNVRRRLSAAHGELQDLAAWHSLAPLATNYLPWTEGALRPGALVAILNDICLSKRELIVECGSGISTIFIARLLKEREKGRLVSLEHDCRWADFVNNQIAKEGLSERAQVVLAVLEDCSLSNFSSAWYQEDSIRAAVKPRFIDMLIVDGPPAFEEGQEFSRYPALPLLKDLLSDDCIVVVDDIDRPAEREILKRWSDETAFAFHLDFSKSLAFGKRRAPTRRRSSGKGELGQKAAESE